MDFDALLDDFVSNCLAVFPRPSEGVGKSHERPELAPSLEEFGKQMSHSLRSTAEPLNALTQAHTTCTSLVQRLEEQGDSVSDDTSRQLKDAQERLREAASHFILRK